MREEKGPIPVLALLVRFRPLASQWKNTFSKETVLHIVLWDFEKLFFLYKITLLNISKSILGKNEKNILSWKKEIYVLKLQFN
jgi:hypothetical protein